jgi:hypothetical protein
MGIITRMKLWRSEWRKLREEIIRTAAILRANQRESEECWACIYAYDAKQQQLMAEINQRLAALDTHHAAEQEKWLAESARIAAEREAAKRALEEVERERGHLVSTLAVIKADRAL